MDIDIIAELASAADRSARDELPALDDFFRGSGTAWGEAAVADGADPEWARASTGRCLSAYVGS
jgi:hypothetical protein